MAFYKDMSHDNAFISHQEVGFPLFLHMELHLNYVFYPRIVAQTTFSNNTLLSVITLHIMAVLHSAQFKQNNNIKITAKKYFFNSSQQKSKHLKHMLEIFISSPLHAGNFSFSLSLSVSPKFWCQGE